MSHEYIAPITIALNLAFKKVICPPLKRSFQTANVPPSIYVSEGKRTTPPAQQKQWSKTTTELPAQRGDSAM
jgi:hypothetical protein